MHMYIKCIKLIYSLLTIYCLNSIEKYQCFIDNSLNCVKKPTNVIENIYIHVLVPKYIHTYHICT